METSTFLENFKNILDDTDVSLITIDTVFRELPEWSSLTALSLIAMADEAYSIKLTGDDIKSSKSLNDIFNIIKSK
jgi:acyl carrier protein